MPEEWRMPAGDTPSSRAATVSSSDDPKSSTRKRSRNPAISSRVSLEGWRTYARFWPWPRGRHGTGRGRRGTTGMEIARSMARFSVARRWEEGAVTEEPGDDEGEGELGPPPEPPAWPELGVAPLKRLRVEGNITGSAERAVSYLDLQPEDWDDTKESGEGELGPPPEPHLAWVPPSYLPEEGGTEDTSHCSERNMSLEALKELGYAWSGWERLHVPMDTQGARAVEGPVEMAMAGLIANEVPRLAKEVAEKPVPGKTGGEIAMEKPRPAKGVVEYPVPVKTGGATKESSVQEEALEKPMAGKTDAEIALAKRWLPLPYPVFPRTGKTDDILKHNIESKRIQKFNKEAYDRIKNLPTRIRKFDHETAASVKSLQERDNCLKAGVSVVAISSVWPGHENHCSGVIIEHGEGTLKILTASGIIYNVDGDRHSPELKVSVQLSNDDKYEGCILFVNKHYRIAILEVCVDNSMASLSVGSMPQYGQRVIALARDCADFFMRDGFISKMERTALGRTHYMYLESEHGFPLHCIGGPVINVDGSMVGIITCHVPEAAMISIDIVQICIGMWRSYSCIARPQIKMDLRTVRLLDAELLHKMQCIYNKYRGFIVDGVEYGSAAEKLGIREGDIIEILDTKCGPTLPELETYLLSHGLRFLAKMKGVSSVKELELKGHEDSKVEHEQAKDKSFCSRLKRTTQMTMREEEEEEERGTDMKKGRKGRGQER